MNRGAKSCIWGGNVQGDIAADAATIATAARSCQRFCDRKARTPPRDMRLGPERRDKPEQVPDHAEQVGAFFLGFAHGAVPNIPAR